MKQAEELSHAGERLPPFLMGGLLFADVPRLKPTVRALSLIGTQNALEVIEMIVERVQPAERMALYDDLPDLADISALRQLPSLESLEVGECAGGPSHLVVARALNLKRFMIRTALVSASYP